MSDKKKFHITITDNATGEAMTDDDTDATIGAYDHGDAICAMGFTKCNAVMLVSVINGAQRVITELLDEHPELATLAAHLKSEN